MAARVLEQLADARGTDARVHLDEVGAAREQERHARLAGDRPREQRLAGARGADQQHAFGNPSADRLEAARLAQEIDDLLHFLFGFVHAGDIGERDRRGFGVGFARLAFERRDAAGRHAVHHEAEHADKGESEHDSAEAVCGLLSQRLHVNAHVLLGKIGHERRVRRHVIGRRDRPKRLAVRQRDVERVAVDNDRRYGSAVEVPQQIRKRHLNQGCGTMAAKKDDAAGRRDEQGGGRDDDRAALESA
jgi:hypothetical protein